MLSIDNEVDVSTIRCLITTSKCVSIAISSDILIGFRVTMLPGLVTNCGSSFALRRISASTGIYVIAFALIFNSDQSLVKLPTILFLLPFLQSIW